METTLISFAKVIIIFFGVFLIGVGFLMFLAPKKANGYIRKAASTKQIHFSEITLRLIPAIALVLYSDASRFPVVFKMLGWFMVVTSLILYFVPRKRHHRYALWCADVLKPLYIRLLAPLSMLFGYVLIHAVSM